MDIELRPALEIQKAHDRLRAIVLGEVPIHAANSLGGEANYDPLHVALDVLCWVLKHDQSNAFGRNLARIDEALAKLGFTLRDTGELRARD